MMKDPSTESIGLTLTPAQLQSVFPYHVAVNEAFEIIQLGNKWIEICDEVSVVGMSIVEIFDIKCPSDCAWTWDEIEINKNQAFNLTLKPSLLSHLKLTEMKTLSLTGSIILQQSDSDAKQIPSPKGAIFLLHLSASNTEVVKESGFLHILLGN